MTGLIAANHILEHEHDPLWNVHLEQLILPDQFPDHLVNGIVQFHELIAFVVLIRKDFLLDVHFHVEEQLEEQLADAQIFADHLALLDWEDVLQLGLLMCAAF